MSGVIQISGIETKDISETCLLKSKYHKNLLNNKYNFFRFPDFTLTRYANCLPEL